MVHVFVRQKIRDYQSWKSVFDSRDDIRVSGGERSWWISHVAGDPSNLVLWFEWDTLEHARNYFESPVLKDVREQSGVLDTPEIYFLEEVARSEPQQVSAMQ